MRGVACSAEDEGGETGGPGRHGGHRRGLGCCALMVDRVEGLVAVCVKNGDGV